MTAATVTPAYGRSRRGVELLMLVAAVLIAIAAYAAVGLAQSGSLPPDMLTYGGGLGGLLLIAHLVLRRWARYADPLLLPCAALLNGLGLVMIHRLDLANIARAKSLGKAPPVGDAGFQLIWTALGIVLFVVVLLVVRDHRVLQRYTYTAMLGGLALLLLPLLPGLGVTVNGARIWIRLAGFSFQPGEVAKIVLMVFFAGYLVVKRDVLALAGRRFVGIDLPRGRDLGPILVAWGASLGVLVFERDLGTSLLFFGAFVVVLYVATQRLSWLLIGLLLFVGGSVLAWALFAHVQQRVEIWLHPFENINQPGGSYQLVQGLYGIASGGVLGSGLGQGRPDLVPLAKSDFIVAAFGEELGVTGLMAVLVVYGIVVERGLRTALASRDAFGKLLATGLAFILALQVFVVVGGVTRLLPLTGLTTPFLAYGGSSLVVNWAIIALLLRISDGARRPAPEPSPVTSSDETTVVRL
ncbi:MAG: FtsW/RodA/SpoVE family cell cycle protein [Actinomycetes bacterium]